MTNKDAHRDWGLCRQTFDILCTLTRMGLKFHCPLEKVILLQVQNDELKNIKTEAYRRKYK